jgi:TonB family protein
VAHNRKQNLLPGTATETALGAKRVYTLEINMPNLTSASGSWIVNFAELNEDKPIGYVNPQTLAVAAPVPLRKVDPKYPPLLRNAHVEGEVVLYAVIRKDGTVNDVRVVQGIDPQLDANSVEALMQWKFQPGEKHGAPVDLEAVVHIPFRSGIPSN